MTELIENPNEEQLNLVTLLPDRNIPSEYHEMEWFRCDSPYRMNIPDDFSRTGWQILYLHQLPAEYQVLTNGPAISSGITYSKQLSRYTGGRKLIF